MQQLDNLSFDPGNGVMFTIEHAGSPLRFFVEQSNEWLKQKEGASRNFPALVKRYTKVILAAARTKAEQGVPTGENWGHLISANDLAIAQSAMQND